MKLIDSVQISLNYGLNDILKNVSFQINSGNRYGLIGENGSGKTSLLNILTGELEQTSGEINRAKGIKIGYVGQYINFSDSITVYDALCLDYKPVIDELIEYEQKLVEVNNPDYDKILKAYQRVRDKYDALECDYLDQRIEQVLDSMGLKDKANQEIGSLSGGEKSVLNLASALLRNPDLLVLDEPGNHLDYSGLDWLEDFLIKFKGTILIVSHNRYLLDRVCTNILELERNQITEYKGNYSAYRMNKLRKTVAQQAEYKANQKKLEQLEALVKRFAEIAKRTADPAWGKRLRARRSQLNREKDNAVEKPVLDSNRINLKLDANYSKANIALRIQKFSFQYGDKSIYKNADLEISCGERVGLIGLNGSGKTTLIKQILENGSWDNANIRIGPSCKIGYLSQKQDTLKPGNTVEEEIISLGSIKSREQAYYVVAPFKFSYKDMDKKICTLSGGEKNRLQLACLKYLNKNFLILDEPTNHLDIASREVMEEALQEFKGTLLIVSHDRYFLDNIVDSIVEVEGEKLNPYIGNFSEFWLDKKFTAKKIKQKVVVRKKHVGIKHDKQNNNNEINEIENKINFLENEKLLLEKKIAESFKQGDFIKGRNFSNKLNKITGQLNKAYDVWEKSV